MENYFSRDTQHSLSTVDKSRVGELMLERNSPTLENLGLRLILLGEIVSVLTKVNDKMLYRLPDKLESMAQL